MNKNLKPEFVLELLSSVPSQSKVELRTKHMMCIIRQVLPLEFTLSVSTNKGETQVICRDLMLMSYLQEYCIGTQQTLTLQYLRPLHRRDAPMLEELPIAVGIVLEASPEQFQEFLENWNQEHLKPLSPKQPDLPLKVLPEEDREPTLNDDPLDYQRWVRGDSNAERIAHLLDRIKEKWPSGRIAQILHNATHGKDTFYWSDEKLIKKLAEYLDKEVQVDVVWSQSWEKS